MVPARVQKIISELNEKKQFAKLCGAGSVTGEAAGMVLVLHDDEDGIACPFKEEKE